MSLEEAYQGFSLMMSELEQAEREQAGDPNAQTAGAILSCALCQEPGEMMDGLLVHKWSGKPQCTYRAYL